MSLATRCTACGTVFRVVEDQLRVSEGWVRCGRCAEVFNAIESLVELDGLPAAPDTGSSHGQRVMDDLARVARGAQETSDLGGLRRAPAATSAPGLTPGVRSDGRAEALLHRVAMEPQGQATAGHEAEAEAEADVNPADARTEWVEQIAGETRPGPARPASPALRADLRAGLADGRAWGAAAEASPDDDNDAASVRLSPEVPAFVRKAERAARWRRPGVRIALSMLALLALATLALQVALTQHDLLAARWPLLKPAIERLCTWSGCQVGLPRRIGSLTVDSSGLVRAGPSGAYRLSLVLRNADVMTLRLPSVDLSLTDAQGRTLARRVLNPADLGSSQDGIAAGAELPLAVSLRTRDPAVVGYTIEIFYP